MNKNTFEEKVKRLQEVDKIIKSLDPSIREASFKLLESYVTEGKKDDSMNEDKETEIDVENFFTKFEHDKPSDNVLLIAAYYYSQYGTSPISLGEIKETASNVGITIPNRPDMTLKAAQRDGKNLFNKAGRDKYKPTVHGEKFFKDTYKVSKGKKGKDEEQL